MKTYITCILLLIALGHEALSSPLEGNPSLIRNEVATDGGYIITPGIGAHKLHETKKKWDEARNVCIDEGAHLAVIKSAAEEAVIAKYQQERGTDDAWIGVHELFRSDEWVTVLDQRLNELGYVHWRVGEPNHGQNEHCVTLTRSGGMNDLDCEANMPFVCKIDFH